MHLPTAYTRYRAAARGAAVVVGVAAVTGAVQLNAALCLLACAGALWVLTGRPSPALALTARAAAGAVALYALATLSGPVPDLPAAGTPVTVAIGFVLMGAALAGPDVRLRGRWSPAPFAAGIVAGVAFAVLVSGGGGPDDVVPLVLDLLFLSAGTLLARPGAEPMRAVTRDTPGAAVLRRLLPVALGAPLLLSVAGPQPAGPVPAALLLALGLVVAWILAREIDVADERFRDVEALRVRAERRHRFGEPAQTPAADPDGGQLPKSVV
jgi:hypothetical protein